MPALYQRRILHHGPDPEGTPVLLADRTVAGCWFELLRQGGCGAAELELTDRFQDPHDIFPGDWISFEYEAGLRWYLGRVEEIQTTLPAGRRIRLEGMSIELNELFPGGFGDSADGARPHRFAATDMFTHDPDRDAETFDSVDSPSALLQLLLTRYVVGHSHVQLDPLQMDALSQTGELVSMKIRGEESIRSIIKDLAVRTRNAAWGVDPQGVFFFLAPRNNIVATYRVGQDIISLSEQRTREQLFNRILLTGDYVYDRRDDSAALARRSYRWRASFTQPESRAQHGERRIRLWLPWVRTQQDARVFAREFFRTYAHAQSSYLVETRPQAALPFPWLGTVRLLDQAGLELGRGQVEAIRVKFDQAPSFRLEIGPVDPRQLWPEPPHDERWELPDELPRHGGAVSLTQSDQESGTGDLTNQSEGIVSSSLGILSLASAASSEGSSHNSSENSLVTSQLSSAEGSAHSSLNPWFSSSEAGELSSMNDSGYDSMNSSVGSSSSLSHSETAGAYTSSQGEIVSSEWGSAGASQGAGEHTDSSAGPSSGQTSTGFEATTDLSWGPTDPPWGTTSSAAAATTVSSSDTYLTTSEPDPVSTDSLSESGTSSL